jgi:hypothetical protein
MNSIKETKAPTREPLFIRFLNRELAASDLLEIFSRSHDPYTVQTAIKLIDDPPNLDEFRDEFLDATRDLIKTGLGDEFKAFVNNYMEPSLVEDVESKDSQFGENISRMARIKDEDAPWIQGLVCYNLCLYIRAFGLQDLKICRVCGKFFVHKGQYALYCSDVCKKAPKQPQIENAIIRKKPSQPSMTFSDLLGPVKSPKKKRKV